MQKSNSTPDRGQRGGFIKTDGGNSIRGRVSAMVVAVTVAAIAMLLMVSAVAGVRVWAAEPTVLFTPADGGTVNDATGNVMISFGADVYSDVACNAELNQSTAQSITNIRVGDSAGAEIPHSVNYDQRTNTITLDPTDDLPNGNIYVELSAGWNYTDADNNNQCTIGTAKSASFTVTTTPTGTITIGQVAGDDVVNGTEDNSDIVVSGSSTGLITGTTVTVDLDGSGTDVSGKTGTTDANGDWSVTVTSAEMIGLGEGSVTITAMAPGAATDGTRTVTYDATAPEITASVGGTSVARTVRGVDTDTGTTSWRYKIIDAEAACDGSVMSSGTSDYTENTDQAVGVSADGKKVCFSSTDSAGNVGYGVTPVITGSGTDSVAIVSGEPTGTNDTTILDVTVAGAGVTHYRHKVVAGTTCASSEYGSETAVTTKITDDISALADGPIVLCVIGRNAAGSWQAENAATNVMWTKDTSDDTTDPTDPVVSPKAISIGTVAGDDMIDITEAASDVVVSGTATGLDGKKITIIFEDGDIDLRPDVIKKTRINSGDWSVTLSHTDIDTLENGFITVIAMTIDGNKYQADRKTIVLDRQGLLNLTQ